MSISVSRGREGGEFHGGKGECRPTAFRLSTMQKKKRKSCNIFHRILHAQPNHKPRRCYISCANLHPNRSLTTMEDIFGCDPVVADVCPVEEMMGECRVQETGVPGLYVVKTLLSGAGTEHILAHMLAEGWVSGHNNNQAMRFGTLPLWVDKLQTVLKRFLESDTSAGKVWPESERWFNQLIANRYDGPEGICSHVDLMKFRDGIFGLTLCGTAAFVLKPKEGGSEEFFMSPGDAYLLTGPARYDYEHAIPERAADRNPDTEEMVARTVRISLTLRRLVGEGEEEK